MKKGGECIPCAHFIEYIEGIIHGSTEDGIEVDGGREQGEHGRRTGLEETTALSKHALAALGIEDLAKAVRCPLLDGLI